MNIATLEIATNANGRYLKTKLKMNDEILLFDGNGISADMVNATIRAREEGGQVRWGESIKQFRKENPYHDLYHTSDIIPYLGTAPKLVDDLSNRILAFVSERGRSQGGEYAEVGDGDLETLYGIVGDLIRLKYEIDAHGELPVVVEFAQCAKEYWTYPLRIPNNINADNPLERGGKIESLIGGLDSLSTKLDIALRNAQHRQYFGEE